MLNAYQPVIAPYMKSGIPTKDHTYLILEI